MSFWGLSNNTASQGNLRSKSRSVGVAEVCGFHYYRHSVLSVAGLKEWLAKSSSKRSGILFLVTNVEKTKSYRWTEQKPAQNGLYNDPGRADLLPGPMKHINSRTMTTRAFFFWEHQDLKAVSEGLHQAMYCCRPRITKCWRPKSYSRHFNILSEPEARGLAPYLHPLSCSQVAVSQSMPLILLRMLPQKAVQQSRWYKGNTHLLINCCAMRFSYPKFRRTCVSFRYEKNQYILVLISEAKWHQMANHSQNLMPVNLTPVRWQWALPPSCVSWKVTNNHSKRKTKKQQDNTKATNTKHHIQTNPKSHSCPHWVLQTVWSQGGPTGELFD